MSYFKMPYALPFRFVKSPKGLFYNNIRRWEFRSNYLQKWLVNETTKLQCEASIVPNDLQIWDLRTLSLAKTIPWAPIFNATVYKIYELNFDINDLGDGLYGIYQSIDLLDIHWEYYSEPISVREYWPETILHEYWHNFNDYDVAFTTGIHFKFRVEAGIVEPNPERERTSFMNQVKKVETLMATPFDTYKLNVGEGPKGVPYWVIQKLNFIWSCHNIFLSGDFDHENGYFQSMPDSKWEVTRVKGFPKYGASLEVIPADNSMSNEYNDTNNGGSNIAAGIVTAYNIETTWFGPKSTIPVIDIEQNG